MMMRVWRSRSAFFLARATWAMPVLLATVLVPVGRAEAACMDGESAACTTSDGCPGSRSCDGRHWGECSAIDSCSPGPSHDPIGALDEVSYDPLTNDVVVRGWALDPDTTGALTVTFTTNGQARGQQVANIYRSDVGTSHPAHGPYHGFETRIAADGWGQHTVCAQALNQGQGANTQINCRFYSVEGKVSYQWGLSDVSRCVADPQQAISGLRAAGDNIGFYNPTGSDGMAYSPFNPHWQGVQRLAFGQGKHLVVSRSGSWRFYVVDMLSRNMGGGAFGPALSYFDKTVFRQENATGFDHAGGIQALGTLLAVPNEQKDAHATRIEFFDMSTPTQPNLVSTLTRGGLMSDEAGAVALTRLQDGKLLMAVGRVESYWIDFYLSLGTSPNSGWRHMYSWHRSALFSVIGNNNYGDYQNLNFVTRCGDGALFLVGMHQDGDLWGDDFADLFQVKWNGHLRSASLTKVANRHLDCDGKCNMDASGGVYVDPNGRLILYSTEHALNGPQAGEMSSANAREF